MCSLLRIVAFIKQYKLEDKTTKDISQIREFGFVVWVLWKIKAITRLKPI